jgi:hypothetical protein
MHDTVFSTALLVLFEDILIVVGVFLAWLYTFYRVLVGRNIGRTNDSNLMIGVYMLVCTLVATGITLYVFFSVKIGVFGALKKPLFLG